MNLHTKAEKPALQNRGFSSEPITTGCNSHQVYIYCLAVGPWRGHHCLAGGFAMYEARAGSEDSGEILRLANNNPLRRHSRRYAAPPLPPAVGRIAPDLRVSCWERQKEREPPVVVLVHDRWPRPREDRRRSGYTNRCTTTGTL